VALSVSRSGYYQWEGTEQSVRAEANAELSKQIRRVYDEHKGRYGSPRITQQLRQEGVVCGENRVARLMRENELAARCKKAFRPRTTLAGEGAAPNLIKELEASAPDQIWVSDITYVAQAEAFFSTLKTECFPDNQVFTSRAQARCELFEYIELYYNNRRLHSALGYQTPCQYETEFKRVIDSEIDVAQDVDVATEDRALLGRTSSADAALQTAGAVASRQPTGPGPVPAGASLKRKIPGGSGDRVTRFLR
jgi:putative transposase